METHAIAERGSAHRLPRSDASYKRVALGKAEHGRTAPKVRPPTSPIERVLPSRVARVGPDDTRVSRTASVRRDKVGLSWAPRYLLPGNFVSWTGCAESSSVAAFRLDGQGV